MSPTEREEKSVGSGQEPKQDADNQARWAWVEPGVWSERMLAALERGIEGGKWFSLIDKVWSVKNLSLSVDKVVRNGGSAGIDRQNVRQMQAHKEKEVERLRREGLSGSYRVQAVRRAWIPKLGSRELRPLGIPAVRDRVVQSALRHVMEPIFERDFAPGSYGFRPGKGCKDALRRVDELLKSGHGWVVDADLKSYFETISHGKLLEAVSQKIADGKVLALINALLKAGVMESAKGWQPTVSGTPQGAVVSPLLANIYLDPLDWKMAESGRQMIRYADDFVILCKSQEEAQAVLEEVRGWTKEKGLSLHPEKTRIIDMSEPGGFDFLGYHFERGMKWPRKKSMERLKEVIRSKTRRTRSQGIRTICRELNRTLEGWFEYFKHSHGRTFPMMDGYIRGRLRSILRKRRNRKGKGRGADHQRWPNEYFTREGLRSLKQMHTLARQSLA